jgi:hypothetical protein
MRLNRVNIDYMKNISHSILEKNEAFRGKFAYLWEPFSKSHTAFRYVFSNNQLQKYDFIIYDLVSTEYGLRSALLFLENIARLRKLKILFVGNSNAFIPVMASSNREPKKDSNPILFDFSEMSIPIDEKSKSDVVMLESPFVWRWTPGFFRNIRDITSSTHCPKERHKHKVYNRVSGLVLRNENKNRKYDFHTSGRWRRVRRYDRPYYKRPDAVVFIGSSNSSQSGAIECSRLKIPTIGIVNSDTLGLTLSFPIHSSDSSLLLHRYYFLLFYNALKRGHANILHKQIRLFTEDAKKTPYNFEYFNLYKKVLEYTSRLNNTVEQRYWLLVRRLSISSKVFHYKTTNQHWLNSFRLGAMNSIFNEYRHSRFYNKQPAVNYRKYVKLPMLHQLNSFNQLRIKLRHGVFLDKFMTFFTSKRWHLKLKDEAIYRLFMRFFSSLDLNWTKAKSSIKLKTKKHKHRFQFNTKSRKNFGSLAATRIAGMRRRWLKRFIKKLTIRTRLFWYSAVYRSPKIRRRKRRRVRRRRLVYDRMKGFHVNVYKILRASWNLSNIWGGTRRILLKSLLILISLIIKRWHWKHGDFSFKRRRRSRKQHLFGSRSGNLFLYNLKGNFNNYESLKKYFSKNKLYFLSIFRKILTKKHFFALYSYFLKRYFHSINRKIYGLDPLVLTKIMRNFPRYFFFLAGNEFVSARTSHGNKFRKFKYYGFKWKYLKSIFKEKRTKINTKHSFCKPINNNQSLFDQLFGRNRELEWYFRRPRRPPRLPRSKSVIKRTRGRLGFIYRRMYKNLSRLRRKTYSFRKFSYKFNNFKSHLYKHMSIIPNLKKGRSRRISKFVSLKILTKIIKKNKNRNRSIRRLTDKAEYRNNKVKLRQKQITENIIHSGLPSYGKTVYKYYRYHKSHAFKYRKRVPAPGLLYHSGHAIVENMAEYGDYPTTHKKILSFTRDNADRIGPLHFMYDERPEDYFTKKDRINNMIDIRKYSKQFYRTIAHFYSTPINHYNNVSNFTGFARETYRGFKLAFLSQIAHPLIVNFSDEVVSSKGYLRAYSPSTTEIVSQMAIDEVMQTAPLKNRIDRAEREKRLSPSNRSLETKHRKRRYNLYTDILTRGYKPITPFFSPAWRRYVAPSLKKARIRGRKHKHNRHKSKSKLMSKISELSTPYMKVFQEVGFRLFSLQSILNNYVIVIHTRFQSKLLLNLFVLPTMLLCEKTKPLTEVSMSISLSMQLCYKIIWFLMSIGLFKHWRGNSMRTLFNELKAIKKKSRGQESYFQHALENKLSSLLSDSPAENYRYTSNKFNYNYTPIPEFYEYHTYSARFKRIYNRKKYGKKKVYKARWLVKWRKHLYRETSLQKNYKYRLALFGYIRKLLQTYHFIRYRASRKFNIFRIKTECIHNTSILEKYLKGIKFYLRRRQRYLHRHEVVKRYIFSTNKYNKIY